MFCILDYNATWFNFLEKRDDILEYGNSIGCRKMCCQSCVWWRFNIFLPYRYLSLAHDSFKILNLELNIHYLVHSGLCRSNQDKWVHGRGQWWPPSYIELVFKQNIKYCKESHSQMSGPNFHHQVTVRGQGIWWIDRNFVSDQSEIAFSI